MGMNELRIDSTLVVVPWLDPIVDEVGFDVFSRYAEMFWLPIMGPSALWIMRRIVMGFDEFPGGYEMDTQEIALAVGLSSPKVPTAHLVVPCVDANGLVPHKACTVAWLCASNFHRSHVARFNASLFHSNNRLRRGLMNPQTINNLSSEPNLSQVH